MIVSIENEIFEKYPDVEIGYLIAQVFVRQNDSLVELLKRSLTKQLEDKNLNLSNFVDHPCISLWRKIYQNDFQLDSKTHCSSLEALLRRVVAGKKIWNISNVVDLYNCCSILSLLPMGGYDLAKISGDIKIRYAKEGEPFFGLNSKEMTTTCSNHVIYADDKRVLCWLWNYKDCKETSIQMDTEYVLFFIDSFNRDMLERAFNLLEEKLTAIQCLPLEKGILNKSAPCIHLSKVGEMCR